MKKSKSQKSSSENGSANNPEQKDFLIVGIGASAGGIQALKVFFENVPADSDIAYVVILHLSPDHDSKLAEVLQTVANIPVTQVTEKVRVEPNHVYVVPPNESLSMVDGYIVVSPIHTIEERRAPVDIFFRTLAESHHERAVAVVLSGTGANGSMGMKRVKERGGVAFVQNPREAEYSDMPRNSIATDLVDAILNVAEIPAKIIAYQENLGKVEIQVKPESRPDEQSRALREIFTQLRVHTGHDFSSYKRPTLLRRIQRRINVRQLPDLPAYAVFIRDNADEIRALLKDLLISVTNFFRDKEAFTALEQDTLPRILHGKNAKDQIRVWVAGCATGEEAYSVAMLLAECLFDAPDAPEIQIFATDIDEQAIAIAREGFYTLNDAADVSPERLRRFFTKERDGYRVQRELREMILFANHNLLKDPPFSRLDLATCRNLLIYLNPSAQERVMEILHFALNPGGYLLLGASESIDGAGDLYATVSKQLRIYQNRQTAMRMPFPVSDLSPSQQFDQPRPAAAQEQENHALKRISYADLHQRLLEQYAPPSIVVSEDYDIVHLSERAGRYLQIAGGEPSMNLLRVIREELRMELRTALFQAVQRQTNVEIKNLTIKIGDRVETINIYVRPVLRQGDTARGFLLVLFEQTHKTDRESEAVFTSHEPIADQLEEELTRSKAQFRTAVEHHEIQAEELKASNEELQAINEELRSTSEELETSKEELQSINEELVTVNQELKVKFEEVTQTSSDLQNLIQSTDIGTIFLDRALRVKRYTPRATDVFNIIPSDIGRPLEHITHKLDDDHLTEDAGEVLKTLHLKEREVRGGAGDSRYLVRLAPYRTLDDKIDGVVLSFQDITDLKRASDALTESEERFSAIVNQTTAGMVQTDLTGKIVLLNDRFGEIVGYKSEELLEIRLHDLTHAEDLPSNAELFQKTATAGEPFAVEMRYVRKDGSNVWVHCTVSAILGADGKPQYILTVALDISKRRQIEEKLAELNREIERQSVFFDVTLSSITDYVYSFDRDGRFLYANQILLDLWKLKKEDALGKTMAELDYPKEVEQTLLANVRQVFDSGQTVTSETFYTSLTGESGYFENILNPVFAPDGSVEFVTGSSRDITERKRRELNTEFLAEISQDLTRLANADEIMQAVGEKLGVFLNISTCLFAEIDETADKVIVESAWGSAEMPDLVGVYRLSEFVTEEFQQAARRGETIVIRDTQTDSLTDAAAYTAYNINSFVSVPFKRSGEWKFLLTVNDSVARDWREDEIELVREVKSRIFPRLERARAEEKLRQSESQLQLVTDAMPVLISYVDAERRYRFVNQTYQDWFGHAPEEIVGKHVREIVGEAAYAEVLPAMDKVLSGETCRFERLLPYKNIGSRFVAVSYVPDKDESGKVKGFYALIEDVSERKQTEEAVRESEARFRRVFSNNMVAMGVWTKSGNITDANDAFLDLIGYTREELEAGAICWNELTPPEYAQRDEQAVAEVWERGNCTPYEKTYIHKDGHPVPILIGGGRFDERIGSGIFFAVDITKRKHAEILVETQKQALEMVVGGQPLAEVLRFLVEIIEDSGDGSSVGSIMLSDGKGHLHNGAAPSLPEYYLEAIEGIAADENVGTCSAAAATFKTVITPDIAADPKWDNFRHLPLELGLRAAWSMPIIAPDGRILGTFGTYFREKREPTELDRRTVEILAKTAALAIERRQAEEIIRKSEEKYRSLFDSIDEGFCTVEMIFDENEKPVDYLFLEINPAFVKQTGLKDATGKRMRELAPLHEEHWFEIYGRVALTGEPVRFENRAEQLGRWFDVFASRVGGAESRKVAVVFTNITERKRMEADLRESEERLRLLIESASDYAIFTMTLDNRINIWNAGAEKVFGWTESEALGQSGEIIFTPEDRKAGAPEQEMKTALKNGRAPDERFHLRKDGSRFYVSGVMMLLKDAAGNVQGFAKIARDMTERLEAEKALHDKEMLQKLVGAQEDERKRIARDLHDELGQQLTALRLQLESARKICEDEEVCSKIDEIQVLAKRIDNDVDFLAWELRPAVLDDLGLTIALDNYVKEWSRHSGITAEFHGTGLKEARLAPEIETNFYRIAQEALNNTHKHARASQASLLLEQRDGQVVMIIEDDGTGFEPEDKLNRNKGLGLTGMHERAALIGGVLEIESAPGSGTTVYVRVPVG